MTGSFKLKQLKFPRVKAAYQEKEKIILELFSSKGIDVTIFIRVFKKEGQLEIWAKALGKELFQWINTYEICSFSGTLGPKREYGDREVPESFYKIDRFNPLSNYYLSLSLGIDYLRMYACY